MRRLIWAPFVPEATDEGWRDRTKERQELDAARFNEAAGEKRRFDFRLGQIMLSVKDLRERDR